MTQHLLFEPDWRPGVARITFNRPERSNALTAKLARHFIDRIHDAEDSEETRCLVICGKQGIFTAGADLEELAHEDAAIALRLINTWTKVCLAVRTSILPVITVVEGPCVGGGYHVALAADYTIASKKAWFRHTGVDAGISPMMPGTAMLPSIIGLKRASSMILSPRKVPAEEAVQMGLCSEVVDEADLDRIVAERADGFVARDPIVVALGKAQINCALGATLASSSLAQMAGFLHSISPEGRARLHAYKKSIVKRR